MNYSLLKILTSLSADNNIAKVLLNNWDSKVAGNIEDKILLSLLANANDVKSDEIQEELPPRLHDCDLRIVSLEIAGFRGIPHAGENGEIYGISMMRSQKKYIHDVECYCKNPKSIVVLGSNGSGKTSVYSSLEYLWKNTTAIARKHRYLSSEEKFYRNHSDQSRDFYISCHLVDGRAYAYSKENRYKISDCVDLRNFFCSESDISIIECGGDSIINFFNGEIGINELVNLRNFLNNNLHSQQEIVNDLEIKIGNGEGDTSEHVRQRDSLLKSVSELKAIIDAIDQEVSGIRKVFYPRAQEILTALLKDYDDGIVRPSFQTEGEVNLFNGMLEYVSKGIKIDPRTYFNNFRFKLYLVSIRIAIAFSIMKSQNICFPLVFDDIFDSSDFNNRLKAEPFFRNIVKLYHKLEINPNPLQIIFFTQDEVIAESVFRGITEWITEDDNEREIVTGDAVYCRLFNPAEINKDDIVRFNDIKEMHSSGIHQMDEEETVIGIKSDSSIYSFYNLYDEIRTSSVFF